MLWQFVNASLALLFVASTVMTDARATQSVKGTEQDTKEQRSATAAPGVLVLYQPQKHAIPEFGQASRNLIVRGKKFTVRQEGEGLGTGAKVWEAALVLSGILKSNSFESSFLRFEFDNPRFYKTDILMGFPATREFSNLAPAQASRVSLRRFWEPKQR